MSELTMRGKYIIGFTINHIYPITKLVTVFVVVF